MRAILLPAACAVALLAPFPARAAVESAVPLRADVGQFLVAAALPDPLVSPLSIAGANLSGSGETDAKKDKTGKPKKPKKEKKEKAPNPEGMTLGPERARILLQSLTIPGWGQATLGRRTSAAFFLAVDLTIWSAFASYSVQEQTRREAYRRTASIGAGIDLTGRDEEFRRIVGSFISSDEYNLLVVSRDAANIYLKDIDHPDMAGYRAYIARYSLAGGDAWNWANSEQFQRYGAQRKEAQRAAIHANNMLGLAIANRLVSALHAARAAGRTPPPHAWHFEVTPAPGGDATAFRAQLRTSF